MTDDALKVTRHWVWEFGERPYSMLVEISQTPEGKFSLGSSSVESNRRQVYDTLEEAETHVEEVRKISQDYLDAVNLLEQWKAPKPPVQQLPPEMNREQRRAAGEPTRRPTMTLPQRLPVGSPSDVRP